MNLFRLILLSVLFLSHCGQYAFAQVPFAVARPTGTPLNSNSPGQVGSGAVNPDGEVAVKLNMFGGTPPAFAPGSGGEATWAGVAIPAATVPSGYTPNTAPTPSVNGLSNSQRLRFCRFRNATNQPVSCSTDGTNDSFDEIAAQSTEWADLAANGRDIRTSIVCKYTSAAPTTGTFRIRCYY